MNAAPEYGAPPDHGPARRDTVVRTLWRTEWRRHRFGVIAAIAVLLPMMALTAGIEPARQGMFFWLAFSLAWGTGLGLGRAEWFEGEEEFHLSLPATRAQRYWVKLSFGALVLLGVYVIGAVTCLTDWLQPFWERMEMKPFETEDLPPWVGNGPDFLAFALVAPLAAYVECLALSMAHPRRGDVGWVWRIVPVLVGGALVLIAGQGLPEGRAGWLYVPAFLGYAVWRAFSGVKCYAAKDAVLETHSGPTFDRQRATLLILMGVLVLLGFAAWFLMSYKNPR